jgi:hypothetical protein
MHQDEDEPETTSTNGLVRQDTAYESSALYVFADIKKHETFSVKTLLTGLLPLCLPEENKHIAPTDLLDQCLNAVIPICNGNVRTHLKD